MLNLPHLTVTYVSPLTFTLALTKLKKYSFYSCDLKMDKSTKLKKRVQIYPLSSNAYLELDLKLNFDQEDRISSAC